jgi:hypothetical protein
MTSPPKRRGTLPPEAIARLHKVIARCDSVKCEWLDPGLEAGLPFDAANTQVVGQQEYARSILKAYGAPLPDSGVG